MDDYFIKLGASKAEPAAPPVNVSPPGETPGQAVTPELPRSLIGDPLIADDAPVPFEIQAMLSSTRKPPSQVEWNKIVVIGIFFVMALAAMVMTSLFWESSGGGGTGNNLSAINSANEARALATMSRAEQTLMMSFAQDGIYKTDIAALNAFDPSVKWGTEVQVQPCLNGFAALLEIEYDGEVASELLYDVQIFGPFEGDQTCPGDADSLDTWAAGSRVLGEDLFLAPSDGAPEEIVPSEGPPEE